MLHPGLRKDSCPGSPKRGRGSGCRPSGIGFDVKRGRGCCTLVESGSMLNEDADAALLVESGSMLNEDADAGGHADAEECLVGTQVDWRRAYAAWGTTAGLLVGVRHMRVAVGGGVVVVAVRGWQASSVLFFPFGDSFLAVRSCGVVLFVCASGLSVRQSVCLFVL